jgi:uncharacterized protein YbgA (DUF1722 family)
VPLTLPKHYLNRYPVPEWVHQQVYLNPYPKELMLPNHIKAMVDLGMPAVGKRHVMGT